jgi:hypothetical protein
MLPSYGTLQGAMHKLLAIPSGSPASFLYLHTVLKGNLAEGVPRPTVRPRGAVTPTGERNCNIVLV